jgi:DNA-binding transcriptional ArsR family regulator
MVYQSAQRIEQTFAALGDPTRLEMIRRLASGPTTIKELRRPFSMSGPAITKHLRILEDVALIERFSKGRSHYCRLKPAGLEQAESWLSQQRALWTSLFDSLETYLANAPTALPHIESATAKEMDYGCD